MTTLDAGVSKKREIPAWIFGGVFVGIFLVFIGLDLRRLGQGHFGDFRHFYYAAVALLNGQDLYRSGTGGYIYPPLIAFLYTPVAHLSYLRAAQVMLIVNSFMAATAIVLAASEYVKRFEFSVTQSTFWGIVLLATILDIDKVKNELQMLQTNALMLLMFVLGLRWLDRKPILTGIALGVIFNIKYLSLAMVPYFILRRRWTALSSLIASCFGFAFLPAVVDGWQHNLQSLKVAFGGLLHMLGVGNGEQANVEDITAMFSSSITSAMARIATNHGMSLKIAMAMAAVIVAITLLIVIFSYYRVKLPLFVWPNRERQFQQPFRAIVGLEWAGLVTGALVFSPQTNTRHLFLALIVMAAASTIILASKNTSARVCVSIGAIIAFLGFVLPPGTVGEKVKNASYNWTYIGGACWCLLICFLTLLWAGLGHASRIQERMSDGNHPD